MYFRIVALIVVSASLYFIQSAAQPILEQNSKVREWPGVDATVTARYVDAPSRVKAAPQPSSGVPAVGTQRIEVVYRYQVDDAVQRVTHPTPTSDEYAPAGPNLMRDGEASFTKRVHYDPASPSRMFVPKAFRLAHYGPIFFWAPLLGLGFGGLVFLRKPGRRGRAPARGDGEKRGWRRLLPKYSIRHRMSGAWGVAIVCNAILCYAAYDWLTGQPRERTTTSNMLVGVAMLPGLAALALAIYYSWMARRVRDARVWIDAPGAKSGDRLAAKFELELKSDVDLEAVIVRLVCVRSEFRAVRGRFAQHVIWEQRAERSLGKSRRAPAGGRVECEQRFDLPIDAQPSFSGGLFGPWIDWEIRVEFHLDRGPDYRGKFPVDVVAAS